MSTPANATEAPSIAKVWQQTKANAPTFAAIWGIVLILAVGSNLLSGFYGYENAYASMRFQFINLPLNILSNLAGIMITAVPAIYYATDHCPGPSETFSILTRKLGRYLLAGALFAVAAVIGLMLCIVPGILVMLTTPLYVHYIFTTDLDLVTCLSKSFKGMFQNSGFGSFLGVSLLCGLAVIAASMACIFPVLAVLPMTVLYMQNYIHHKGLVGARELA